jgi:hypothetical protein
MSPSGCFCSLATYSEAKYIQCIQEYSMSMAVARERLAETEYCAAVEWQVEQVDQLNNHRYR